MVENIVALVALVLVGTVAVGVAEAVSPKLGTLVEVLVVGGAAMLVVLFVLAVVFTGLWISLRELAPW